MTIFVFTLAIFLFFVFLILHLKIYLAFLSEHKQAQNKIIIFPHYKIIYIQKTKNFDRDAKKSTTTKSNTPRNSSPTASEKTTSFFEFLTKASDFFVVKGNVVGVVLASRLMSFAFQAEFVTKGAKASLETLKFESTSTRVRSEG